MVFHWSLRDIKSPQVSRTLLSFLGNLNDSVVRMVLALAKSLGMVSSSPITIGITVNFMFHNFFSFLARSKDVSIFTFSLIFTPWFAGTTKSTIRGVLFWWFFLLSLDLIFWTKSGDLFVFQNHREFCVSHFPGRIIVCAYTI